MMISKNGLSLVPPRGTVVEVLAELVEVELQLAAEHTAEAAALTRMIAARRSL